MHIRIGSTECRNDCVIRETGGQYLCRRSHQNIRNPGELRHFDAAHQTCVKHQVVYGQTFQGRRHLGDVDFVGIVFAEGATAFVVRCREPVRSMRPEYDGVYRVRASAAVECLCAYMPDNGRGNRVLFLIVADLGNPIFRVKPV